MLGSLEKSSLRISLATGVTPVTTGPSQFFLQLAKSWRKPFTPKFIATSFNIKFCPHVNLVSDLNYQLRLPSQILRTSYLVTWIKVVSQGQFFWICQKLLTPRTNWGKQRFNYSCSKGLEQLRTESTTVHNFDCIQKVA